MMKDGKTTELDAYYVPWGMGSSVHSLIDTVLVFLDEEDIARKLKYLFYEKVDQGKNIKLKGLTEMEKKISLLNEEFNDNYEVRFEHYIEAHDENWKNSIKEENILDDGTMFVGEESYGAPNGYGHHYSDDNELIYRGLFEDGIYHGTGELLDVDTEKRIYLGNFHQGKPNGFGVWYNENEEVHYFGNTMQGLRHGDGELYSTSGVKFYRGGFYKNKRHGFGMEFDKMGRMIFSGEYKFGTKEGFGIEYSNNGTPFREGIWNQNTFKAL